MVIKNNPAPEEWMEITRRPVLESSTLEAGVMAILEDVRQNGDATLKMYAEKFDAVSMGELLVSEAEIQEASALTPATLKDAIGYAKVNISKFHEAQQQESVQVETMEDVFCWRKSVAIEKVGLYIPGGTAPLFSTLLMLGIPAVLAGCSSIVVCTPAGKDGKISPAILYTAQLLGLKNIYKVGGAQAIAAMAYGTESIPAVYKIFGPGNQYVTCAKQLVGRETTAIDMPAGPSEVAVYADDTANASFVASDLLSQAEHGKDSQVLLVVTSASIAEAVKTEVELQLDQLPRKDFAAQALENSQFVVMKDIDAAFKLLNLYAPEHLIIASDSAEELSHKVVNAGSVFLGHYSSESIGDYAAGTNHTLPTNGYARVYSGVSLDSFLKKITFQKVGKVGLKNIGNIVEIMAEAEGLEAHKNAVSIRLKSF
jgi:histidinol dehydrogenase